MNFSRIRLDLFCFFQGNPGQFAPLIGMVEACPVKVEVSLTHETVGAQEFRVAPDRFLQQRDSLKQTSFGVRVVRQIIEVPRSQIQIVSHQIVSRRFGDLGFFIRGQMHG